MCCSVLISPVGKTGESTTKSRPNAAACTYEYTCVAVQCSALQYGEVCYSVIGVYMVFGCSVLISFEIKPRESACCCELQCVSACCRVCCTVCCSMVYCVAVWCSALQCGAVLLVYTCFAVYDVCCIVLQCVAARCSVLQCVAVCCSVLQCVAVCCSVLQCVAVCCSVLQRVAECVAECVVV